MNGYTKRMCENMVGVGQPLKKEAMKEEEVVSTRCATTINYYESLLSLQKASYKAGGGGSLEVMLMMTVKELILMLAPNGVRLNAEFKLKYKQPEG